MQLLSVFLNADPTKSTQGQPQVLFVSLALANRRLVLAAFTSIAKWFAPSVQLVISWMDSNSASYVVMRLANVGAVRVHLSVPSV